MKKIIGMVVLIILAVISIRTVIINKDAKDKNRTAVVVDESFPIGVPGKPEMKDSQSNPKLTSTKPDNEINIENVSSDDPEDPIFERDEFKNDLTEFEHYMVNRNFSEIHEPFLRKIGVSQNKIDDIYDFYMEATMEIININNYRESLEDYELIGEITKNYNDYVMEVLGDTDGEKYNFFISSFTERMLANELNKNLDNEDQLDNDQLEELTTVFYNIREKYFDIKYQVGAGFQMTSKKMEGIQSPEEIDAIIVSEYIDSTEDILTGTQLELLKKVLSSRNIFSLD